MNSTTKYTVKTVMRLQFLWICLLLLVTSCVKVEYSTIEEPAYLRVFNSLNYKVSMEDKDGKPPYFCMLINPEIGADGKPIGAEIVGDFLDIRNPYAPPYPSHIGTSTTLDNPEYPGKRNVLVGPILNGYDLSSWAQVPSGKLRVMFIYRPKNTVGYFDLEPQLQGDVMLDTYIELGASEVYTLHLLQKDFKTKENDILLRQENFHKQALSDSLVYINFYNYSAEGYVQADHSLKPSYAPFKQGIQERMNVFLSLYPNEEQAFINNSGYERNPVPGYKAKLLTSLERDNRSNLAKPYVSFPLWANPADNGIRTNSWQQLEFMAPGLNPAQHPYDRKPNQEWEGIAFIANGTQRSIPSNFAGPYIYYLPNMLVNIHSGTHNPRSFATVNTVEIINGFAYLTTIQRKYPAPIY